MSKYIYETREFPYGYLRDDGFVFNKLCGCDNGEITMANGQDIGCDCLMHENDVKAFVEEKNKVKLNKYKPSVWEELDII